MQSKTISAAIALSAFAALVLCGPSGAQTVPPEAWVGPPIATGVRALSREAVNADLQRALSSAQAPQEAWVGSASEAVVHVGAATRAEVMADLNLYDRAGLLGAQGSDVFDPFSASMQQRMQSYVNLRHGSAFAREVARLEGREGETLAFVADDD